ncbi:conserved membrane hypothetical protein [Methylocella tundrae]|uniref:Oligosaccharide repeat unit polymerase n=1 Tax=Methylocella tundrae TaxID=227605 RepID=A0A8B6M9F0_METTU|nr:hypothetical protein [Methylocella tundrae]VTZ27347.1 conserved membrane hypothetical protein [Methylocella tundrae]VTZ51540.1 conserved membrane hypothetical protein [Methylocella tundrae]
MANYIGSIDLKSTRVPIAIPLGVTCVFEFTQLYLGADPLIVFMSAAGITITFIPLYIYGRDLYAMFSILFSVRYIGAALVIKTLYGQPLQSNLLEPTASYAWALLLMAITTTVILAARHFDPGKTLFPFPNDPKSLRRLALICFVIGTISYAIVGATDSNGTASAGVLFIVVSSLASLSNLGLIAEAAYAIEKSGRRTLFSPRLLTMLAATLLIVIALNARGAFLNGVIAIVVIAFIYRVIHFRYIVIGALFLAFFMYFLSPMTLYLRMQRMPKLQFIQLALDTAVKATFDSNFRKTIYETAKYTALGDIKDDPPYDYYGDRSNVGNRLSFIGLLDAVYSGTKTRALIGSTAIKRSLSDIMPGFLGYVKEDANLGDWMGWQVGILQPPYITYINFGLPMEGLATWGWPGFIAYPVIFILPVLLAFARISSFRMPLPLSIYLFTILQTGMIEWLSNGFMVALTREIPVLLVALTGIYFVFFRHSTRRHPLAIAPSTPH